MTESLHSDLGVKLKESIRFLVQTAIPFAKFEKLICVSVIFVSMK